MEEQLLKTKREAREFNWLEAYEQFKDGELMLEGLGDAMLDAGLSPRQIRRLLSDDREG